MSTSYPPNPANPYPPVQPMVESDQRLWATLIHIGGIFFGFLAPLVGYLVLKDRGNFVRQHTVAALNFQLTALIAWLVIGVVGAITLGIGLIFYPILGVVITIFAILAAVAANRGEHYTYPATIKFVN